VNPKMRSPWDLGVHHKEFKKQNAGFIKHKIIQLDTTPTIQIVFRYCKKKILTEKILPIITWWNV
jgi:hypothetical protein